jgi:hypothetical protein
LYYFSVANVSTAVQAVHWLAAYPLAGCLWAAALTQTARRMRIESPPLGRVYLALSLAAIPIALPGPWMAWIAGSGPEGFEWGRMVLVALRREESAPWTWLTPLYFGLGLLSLGAQLFAYRRLYPIPFRKAVVHYLVSAIALSLAAAVIGAVAAYPLRVLEWF